MEQDDEYSAADMASMGVISVGDLLGTAGRAVGENVIAFVGITAFVMSPAMAASIGYQEWMNAQLVAMQDDPYSAGSMMDFAGMSALGGMGVYFVQVALQFLAQAVVMHATVEFMAGRKAQLGHSLSVGFSRAAVVLALAFFNTIAIVAGLLFCVVPGIVIACILYASVPSAVVERLGPIDAMQRSAELTDGHRVTIFLVLLVIYAAQFALGCAANMGLGGAGALSGETQAIQPLPLRIAGYGISWAIVLFSTMFSAVAAAVFYARVRGIRDGVDANAIADVFA